MYSLILDSSNKDLIVAIAKNKKIVDEITYEARQRQSEFMVKEISNLFDKNEFSPKDISDIIVTKGPGSYTGVRIALTIAKTYAYSLNIPCYLVSSLNILTSNNFRKKTICLIDARGNRSYIGIYKGKEAILEDRVMNNKDVLDLIIKYKNYEVSGDLDYLNLKGIKTNKTLNMIKLKNKANLVVNNKTIKAIYLKD